MRALSVVTLDARDLGAVGAHEVDQRAAGVDDRDDGRDAARAPPRRGGLGGEPGALVGERGDLGVVKSAAAPASEIASSSSGVSPLVPIAPTTSPSTRQRDAAGQARGAVQRERAEAAVA